MTEAQLIADAITNGFFMVYIALFAMFLFKDMGG